jgi:1,4-dihydroxy-2-naphthoate octaprenyltransferase
VVVGLVLACCALGYVYQAPPWRLGYQGWGEVLCFISFGPLALSAAYYSQAHGFSPLVWWASLPVGLSISLVLFCSHFHQVADDLAAGKRSPVVRLGTARSARLIPFICGLIYLFGFLGIGLGYFPIQTLLSMLSLPFAVQLCQLLLNHHSEPEVISHSKFIALKFQFAYCLGLGLGFWL